MDRGYRDGKQIIPDRISNMSFLDFLIRRIARARLHESEFQSCSTKLCIMRKLRETGHQRCRYLLIH